MKDAIHSITEFGFKEISSGETPKPLKSKKRRNRKIAAAATAASIALGLGSTAAGIVRLELHPRSAKIDPIRAHELYNEYVLDNVVRPIRHIFSGSDLAPVNVDSAISSIPAIAYSQEDNSPSPAPTLNATITPPTENRYKIAQAVGQMVVAGFNNSQDNNSPDKETLDLIKNGNLGGVILSKDNLINKEQTIRLTTSLQQAAAESSSKNPLLIGIDQEGGLVSRAPWIKSPSARELGNSGNPKKANSAGANIGRQLKEVGINTDFAPVADSGDGEAIGSRSFSNKPDVVASMSIEFSQGLISEGVIPTVKHFPNHGTTDADSHFKLPVVNHDMTTILNKDIPPFKAAIDAGVPMVMMGHLIYPVLDKKNPASQSKEAYDLLMKKTGFTGVKITDSLNMHGAGNSVVVASINAIKAGADMVLMTEPKDREKVINAVVEEVENGKITPADILTHVKTIEHMKQKYPKTDSQNTTNHSETKTDATSIPSENTPQPTTSNILPTESPLSTPTTIPNSVAPAVIETQQTTSTR